MSSKFTRASIGLILPGTDLAKEIPIKHVAPNSIQMTFPHFLELVKELEYLQDYYQEKENAKKTE